MSKFLNTTTKTVAWFKKANENGELEMKPPFQRNPVWTKPQKSYLIDSILNGYPIPEIYMQEFVDETGNEKHVIIDGQQRIRACLEYLEGGFSIQAEESPSWADMRFDDLSPDDKRKIFGYIFIVRKLPDMSDDDIRGIFQRLNKNVVALNAQEMRQATYWGPFISAMQEIANYSYWGTTGVFSPLNIRRMMDIEFISELSIAVLHGHQNKKETLDKYYLQYEEEFDQKEDLLVVFRKVIVELENILPDIKNARWRKKTDFYSLFHYLASQSGYFPLGDPTRTEIRRRLDEFSRDVSAYLSTESSVELERLSDNVKSYGSAVRASSDLGNRKKRQAALRSLLDSTFQAIAQAGRPILPMQGNLFEASPQEEDE